MLARSFAFAVLCACLLLGGRGLVLAADDPAAALAADWPRAADDARQALLDAAVAAPSRSVLDALTKAARFSLGLCKEADRFRASYEAARKELGDDVKDGDPRLAADRAEVEKQAKQAERERAGLARLASAFGRVLDALPEADATAAIKDQLRAAPDRTLEGFAAWVGEGLGASRLVRSAVPLIDTPAEARKEIVKLQGQRTEPARKLEDVIKKLNDLVGPYLKAARAKGDDSGKVPVGLVGKLPEQKDELDKVVNKLGDAIEAADERRRTAREALGRMLAGLTAADADHVLDLVENRLLKDDDVENRAFGWLALGAAAGPRPLRLLGAAADGKDPRDAAAALDAMGDRPEPEIVAILGTHLADEAADWRVRTSAAQALARTGTRGRRAPAARRDEDSRRDGCSTTCARPSSRSRVRRTPPPRRRGGRGGTSRDRASSGPRTPSRPRRPRAPRRRRSRPRGRRSRRATTGSASTASSRTRRACCSSSTSRGRCCGRAARATRRSRRSTCCARR